MSNSAPHKVVMPDRCQDIFFLGGGGGGGLVVGVDFDSASLQVLVLIFPQ